MLRVSAGSGIAFNEWVSFKSVCMAEKQCIGGEGHDLFRKGISHKKIPLSFGVAKNSRSTPLNSWESPMNLLDLEFLATGSEPYRYALEKNGHGRNRGRCKGERVHANTFERY